MIENAGKIKRVFNSKNPNIKQMEAMAYNLSLHLATYTNVSVSVRSHTEFEVHIKYGIYIDCDGEATHEFSSWPKALSFYRSLMKGSKDV